MTPAAALPPSAQRVAIDQPVPAPATQRHPSLLQRDLGAPPLSISACIETCIHQNAVDPGRFRGLAARVAIGLVAMAMLFATSAVAAVCRDGACACGDTVQGEVRLVRDLTGCEKVGLRVESGATLDCDGNCGACPRQTYCPCVNPAKVRSKNARGETDFPAELPMVTAVGRN